MWVAVYWAKERETAVRIQSFLDEAGVLVKIRNIDKTEIENCFEILVEQSDVEKAHGIIIDRGF